METFREILNKLLIPLGKLLAALHLSPNSLSFSGIIFGFVSGYFFFFHNYLLAILFYILSALADGVDGIVARLRGMTSIFGAFFDNLCGGYADAAVFTGLILGNLCSPIWGITALLGTMLRMLTFRLPSVISPGEEAPYARFPYALGGKGDRLIIISVGIIIRHISESVIAVAVLTNFIVVLRTIYCYRLVKNSQKIKLPL